MKALKANELRCGNYVTIHNKVWSVLAGKTLIVTGIEVVNDKDFPLSDASVRLEDVQSRNYYHQFSEFVKPIELTEDWLVKFGLSHENTIGGFSKWSNKKLKLLDMKFYFDSSESFIRIQYVHQLQNLYFSLTGSELTLNTL